MGRTARVRTHIVLQFIFQFWKQFAQLANAAIQSGSMLVGCIASDPHQPEWLSWEINFLVKNKRLGSLERGHVVLVQFALWYAVSLHRRTVPSSTVAVGLHAFSVEFQIPQHTAGCSKP